MWCGKLPGLWKACAHGCHGIGVAVHVCICINDHHLLRSGATDQLRVVLPMLPPVAVSAAIIRDGLPVEYAGDGLMPAMLPIGFLAIEPEGFEHRRILDGKQDRCLSCVVGVFMPRPRRHREKIPLAPVEALPSDDTAPLPGKDMVDGTARLAMGVGPHPWSEQLDPAGHSAERRATS